MGEAFTLNELTIIEIMGRGEGVKAKIEKHRIARLRARASRQSMWKKGLGKTMICGGTVGGQREKF